MLIGLVLLCSVASAADNAPEVVHPGPVQWEIGVDAPAVRPLSIEWLNFAAERILGPALPAEEPAEADFADLDVEGMEEFVNVGFDVEVAPAALELNVVPAGPAPEKENVKPAASPSTAPAESKAPILRLKNGDSATGTLADSKGGERIRWRSPLFSSPIEFSLSAVDSVRFAATDAPAKREGEYCFEIVGGDLIFGSLVSLDDARVGVDIAGRGRWTIRRESIGRMYRPGQSADWILAGALSLSEWTVETNAPPTTAKPGSAVGNLQQGAQFQSHATPVAADWREEAGSLVTEQAGAAIQRDFPDCPVASYEFELSWKKKADFDLSIGMGSASTLPPQDAAARRRILAGAGQPSDKGQRDRAFHFEVWDEQLVVVRDGDTEADFAVIQKIPSGAGRVHLQAYVDQRKGRILVFSSSGQPLADLIVPAAGVTSGRLRLANLSGDVRLERLRVARWNGDPPRPAQTDKARIHRADGQVVYGQIKSYDSAKQAFIVVGPAGETSIPESEIQDIFLTAAANAAAGPIQAVLRSGERIGGVLEKVAADKVWIKSPAVEEDISIPFDSLQSLIAVVSIGDSPALPRREGRLEMEGIVLHGCLVDGKQSGGGCLAWQARGATAARCLAPNVMARIVYKDPPPPRPAVAQSTKMVAGPFILGGRQVIRSNQSPVQPSRQPRTPSSNHVLHLRTGDMIPCIAKSIDEKGISIESKISDVTFVPHDRIQALELMPSVNPTVIPKSKKERLLMLPRMQRDNPPTHLIRSSEGDYLRCRLIEMNDKQLQVEVRLDTRSLPRDAVARILWLRDDGGTSNPKPMEGDPEGPRVQALLADGNRITFTADRVEGSTLSGRSELLGHCRVDLDKTDQVFVGGAIERAAAELAFHQWRLTAAPDPLSPDEMGEGGEGQESALVGRPAPDFELKLLSGAKFHLADHKDSIVILDFWASWCGPCLATIPQVEATAREFADRGVKLIAVNLEESPEKIKAALERLKLDMTVALDSDGRVAEKYGATSIPQTVVIDKGGKVARVFVGGSANFGEQLKEALESVLNPPAPKGG